MNRAVYYIVETAVMPNLQIVPKEDLPVEATSAGCSMTRLVVQWSIGTILAFLIGSWLVWWGLHLQRQFTVDEIRGACQRVMPETAERCVDTVIIQRGGPRR
ncbi:MAG: hypothetical protein CAF45_003945 [Nitrospira sp. CG24E]|nr:MAG: hypothetical protein CAF45_003945 [Nitrospira sp. CG24E]